MKVISPTIYRWAQRSTPKIVKLSKSYLKPTYDSYRVNAAQIYLLLCCLMLTGCGNDKPFFGNIEPRNEQLLYFNNGTEPGSLDPQQTAATQDSNIIQNLLEGLVVYDPATLEPRPGVAERWAAQEDARRWLFYLRKNARWSDGQPVTAQDFVYAWQRAVTPETGCPYSYMFFYIKNGEAIAAQKAPASALGVRAIDEHTLEVEMERPTAFFLQMLPATVFSPLPRRAIEQWGKRWTDPAHIVTNGPFLLAKHKPYDEIVLIKNPDYWDAASVKLSRAVILPITAQNTNINLYKAGEIDVMVTGLIPQVFTKAIIDKHDFLRGPSLQTIYYSFNLQRKPLDDVRVRRALNLAIDKKLIAETLYWGRGVLPAYTFVPPGMPGYQPPPGEQLNAEMARRLLAEAGYPEGVNFPVITISFPSHSGAKRLCEAIQQMWQQQLKIRVELQGEEFKTFLPRLERREFDICYEGWNGDYVDPNTFLDLFTSNNPNNHSGWLNEQYKNLVTVANSQIESEQRMQALAQAETILLSDTPIAPVYFVGINYMKKPYVSGWEMNLLDQHPLKYVSIDTAWRQTDVAAGK